MFQNIRRDTNKKNSRSTLAESHGALSVLQNRDTISRATNSNINEVIDLVEDSNQMEEDVVAVEPDAVYDGNLSDDDGLCYDTSILDILEVECKEGFSDTKSVECNKTVHNKGKIYPIENICVVCKKKFSCQKEFGKHAQQDHPNEKAFKCQHCPALFSKFKSVTAHFNRRHTDLEKSKPAFSKSQKFNSSSGMNEAEIFSNRKGKIYPIENKCAVCEKKFLFQKNLVKHAQLAHPYDKVYKCLYCSTIFSKLKSVTIHYKRGHSKLRKSFICEYCNMSFFTHFLLDRHRRSHTEQRPYACKLCGKTYKYKRNLLVHTKTHSKTADLMQPDGMQLQFTEDEVGENYEQTLLTGDEYCDTNDQHLSSENGEDGMNKSELLLADGNSNNITNQYPFKCNECHETFKYKKNFKYHQKSHRTSNEATETITLYDTTTNEQNINFYNSTYFIIDELNTDTEQFENLGEESFAADNYSDEYSYEDFVPGYTQDNTEVLQNECGICMKVFKCQQAVAKHLQRCHPEIEFFKCPYCDDNFYSLEALSKHITVRKHPQKRNICEICLKSFDRRSDLKRHVRIHTDERPYFCDFCGKTFKQTNHLKRHKEISHESVEHMLKFACHLCPRSFLLEETLKRHLSEHEKETRYPCSMCNKSFKSRYEWQRHQETHSSRKYLICEFCLLSFDDIQSFDLHIKAHTGERKYLCTICDKSYREKSHLVNHRKFHTNC